MTQYSLQMYTQIPLYIVDIFYNTSDSPSLGTDVKSNYSSII